METKKLYEVQDDEQNVSAMFERNHNPNGFRPHEILRVTIPAMAKIQAIEPSITNVKSAFIWLCSKAGITLNIDELDSRTFEQRQKSRTAKTDTTKIVESTKKYQKAIEDAIKSGSVTKNNFKARLDAFALKVGMSEEQKKALEMFNCDKIFGITQNAEMPEF